MLFVDGAGRPGVDRLVIATLEIGELAGGGMRVEFAVVRRLS
jgi:hypothetical protein